MDKEPITVNGLKKLKLELEDLKNIQRPRVVEAIAEARSHGDLKENAEYHAAKEQQGLIEGRVLAINDLIARANVIDVTKIENKGKVIFVSTTKLKDFSETLKKILKSQKQKFPDDGRYLMYNGMKQGRQIGKVLKKKEEEGIKNNIKISENKMNEIIRLHSN